MKIKYFTSPIKTMDELNKAKKLLFMKYHPDHNHSDGSDFIGVQKEYDNIKNNFDIFLNYNTSKVTETSVIQKNNIKKTEKTETVKPIIKKEEIEQEEWEMNILFDNYKRKVNVKHFKIMLIVSALSFINIYFLIIWVTILTWYLFKNILFANAKDLVLNLWLLSIVANML